MELKSECLFCRIIERKIPAKVIYENEKVLAFHDINPQAPVHIIVIPKNHIERVSDLKRENADWGAELILAANKIASDLEIKDSGYRLIINCNKDAGQAVFHLHLHLLGGRKMGWPPG